MNYMVPFVLEQTAHGERQYDIFSRLQKDRMQMFSSPVRTYCLAQAASMSAVLLATRQCMTGSSPPMTFSLFNTRRI